MKYVVGKRVLCQLAPGKTLIGTVIRNWQGSSGNNYRVEAEGSYQTYDFAEEEILQELARKGVWTVQAVIYRMKSGQDIGKTLPVFFLDSHLAETEAEAKELAKQVIDPYNLFTSVISVTKG